MSQNYIVFRIINEARRISANKTARAIMANQYLFQFATTGFLATQAMAIRRLVEMGSSSADKQVISLRRLIDDLWKHRHLFTREIFVGFDGAPFDPQPAHSRWWAKFIEQIDAKGGSACKSEEYLTAGPEAWQWSYRQHDCFDRFVEQKSVNRNRTDRVSDKVFSSLKKLVENPSILNVCAFANKRVAHSADLVSRTTARHSEIGISFNDIDAAHRSLITAAQFVSSVLLAQTNIGTVPIPQFDAFEFAETAGLDYHSVTKLRRLADCLAGRRDRWARQAADTVLRLPDGRRADSRSPAIKASTASR